MHEKDKERFTKQERECNVEDCQGKNMIFVRRKVWSLTKTLSPFYKVSIELCKNARISKTMIPCICKYAQKLHFFVVD